MGDVLRCPHAAGRHGGEVGGPGRGWDGVVALDGDEAGATALTVMPNGPNSRAQLRISPICAFLAVAYADRPGGGRSATSESIWMIRPNRRACILGTIARRAARGS